MTESGASSLQIALTNWAPRFTANGVDASDLARITGRITTWDDWCASWSTEAEGYAQLAEAALADGRTTSAGEHLARAATYFHFAKFLFGPDRDAEDAAHRRAVTCLTRALPLLNPPGRYIKVPYRNGHLTAILRIPPGTSGPSPVVILIPGLDSTKEEFRDLESVMHSRGLATISLDGPGQGESERDFGIEPRYELATGALVDALAGEDELDLARLGVFGVSLGGYYAIRAAAHDTRFKACVSLSGPYNLRASWNGLPSLTKEAFIIRGKCKDEQDAMDLADQFRLEESLAKLKAPLLVIAGKKDALFDWRDTIKIAETQGPSKLILLESGNHGCANMIHHHRPASADFLAEVLKAQ